MTYVENKYNDYLRLFYLFNSGPGVVPVIITNVDAWHFDYINLKKSVDQLQKRYNLLSESDEF